MPKKKAPPKEWCKRCRERDAAPNPKAPLINPKWEKFCHNVALVGMSNSDAYKNAGFAAKNVCTRSGAGTLLRKKIEVENRIIALTERAIERDLKTRDWVDDQLKEVVDRCMQKEPVIPSGRKGKTCPACHNHLGEWKFDARGANTALQLMGKDRGMFIDKVQIIDDELANKTPEQLAEVIKAAAIELGRDFVRQLGEAVGLFETDSETAGEAKTPTVEPVSTLQ